jgi:hypothetical protein
MIGYKSLSDAGFCLKSVHYEIGLEYIKKIMHYFNINISDKLFYSLFEMELSFYPVENSFSALLGLKGKVLIGSEQFEPQSCITAKRSEIG